MGNGNRPTPEFRREAVRLALTSGRTRREIAEDRLRAKGTARERNALHKTRASPGALARLFFFSGPESHEEGPGGWR